VTCTRGVSNGNSSGSSYDRRAQKLWLLAEYGDGELTTCYRCAVPLLYDDLTRDRIIPGVLGGKYVRSNLRPACGPCNESTGGELAHEKRQAELRQALHRV
jgi:5-methylcytosine-specific restriction endonuclease McrA